jgi:hypothetical protein
VREVWPHVEPLLRSALDATGLGKFQDVEDDILFGNALVWVAWSSRGIEAAASTALVATDAGLVCLITACGGTDLHRWLPLLRRIEDYAKAEGCKRTRIIGRKGWMRVLDGYHSDYVILDKSL